MKIPKDEESNCLFIFISIALRNSRRDTLNPQEPSNPSMSCPMYIFTELPTKDFLTNSVCCSRRKVFNYKFIRSFTIPIKSLPVRTSLRCLYCKFIAQAVLSFQVNKASVSQHAFATSTPQILFVTLPCEKGRVRIPSLHQFSCCV